MATLDPSLDHQVWDNVEPIRLIYGDEPDEFIDVSITKWGPLSRKDVLNPLLQLRGNEIVCNIPKALTQDVEVKQDMVIYRGGEDGTQYVITSVSLLHLKSRWRCIVVQGRINDDGQ